MQASDIMSGPVYIVSPAENVARARNLMLKHKISRLLVMDNGKLAGIITKKDIGYRLRQSEPMWRRRPIDHIPVSQFMTADPICLSPGTGVRDIAALMVNCMISGFPVVENGEVVGVVTKSDMMRSAFIGQMDGGVADIMEDAATVSRYHSLAHVIDVMSERDDKVVVVNDNGTLAGIITESNLAFYRYEDDKSRLPENNVTMLRKEEAGGRKSFRHVLEMSAIAEDLMTRPVITCPLETPIREAVQIMRDHHINSIVVVDAGGIRGIVKRDDIIKDVAP
jgi:CBS domain-containing protein